MLYVTEVLIGTYGEEGVVRQAVEAISQRAQEVEQSVTACGVVLALLKASQVCLKTLVLLHRTLREGSQPIVSQAVSDNMRLMGTLSAGWELPEGEEI